MTKTSKLILRPLSLRPTTTQEVEDELISARLGNYVVVAGDHSSDSASLENNNIPDISNFQKLNLYAAFSAGQGTAGGNVADHSILVIGSARCRGLYRETTGRYRMHLFDIRMKHTHCYM